jgi:hypothetical protein
MALEAFEVDKDLPPGVMISGRHGKLPPFWHREARLLLHWTARLHHRLLWGCHRRMMVMFTAHLGLSAPPAHNPEC